MLANYSGFGQEDCFLLSALVIVVYFMVTLVISIAIRTITFLYILKKSHKYYRVLRILVYICSWLSAIVLSAVIAPIVVVAAINFYFVFYVIHLKYLELKHIVNAEIMPARLIPDVVLMQYLAYKEWRLAACSDMVKKLMAFRQVSRSGLIRESYLHWRWNRARTFLISKRLSGNWPIKVFRQQTKAVWFFNYSTFIPVASDLRIQFGVFRGLFTDDWARYAFIFNEPQSEPYTPWPKFIQKFLTKEYIRKEDYYKDKEWDRLRVLFYEVVLDHSDGTYRCFKSDLTQKIKSSLKSSKNLPYANKLFNSWNGPQINYSYYDNKELQAEWLRGGKNWKKSATKYLRELRKTNQIGAFVETYSSSASSSRRTTYPFRLKWSVHVERRRFFHLTNVYNGVWTWEHYKDIRWSRNGLNFV